MPLKTRDIALDSWLLMVSAAFVLMGLAGLAPWPDYPQRILLLPDTALAAVLSGLGLLAVVQHWPRLRWLAGGALLVLALYTLVHNGLIGGSQVGVSWLSRAPRFSSSLAVILVVLAGCLLVGLGAPAYRRAWALAGVLMLLFGLGILALMVAFPAAGPGLQAMTSSPLVIALFAMVYGASMLVASARPSQRKLELGPTAVMVGLAGVLVSSLAWHLLSGQHQQRVYQQAEYLLDNVRLNAEQVMSSQLMLMQRMAERLDASAVGLEAAVLNRDVANYLRDTPSLEVIALRDSQQDWRWHRARSAEAQRWLTQWAGSERVRDWFDMPFPQPRLMSPDADAPQRAIMVIALPQRDQQLVAVMNLATLLDHELRLQLADFQVNVSRNGALLFSLTAPGVMARDVSAIPALASRHIGLPGGPMLSPAVYSGPGMGWQAGISPYIIGMGGLMLSYLLVFSLGMVRLVLSRSRDLMSAREHLEHQYAIQGMIAEEAPLEQTLDAICRMLEARLQGGLCSIMRVDDEGRRLRLVAGSSLPPAFREAVSSIPIGAGIGACGSCAHDREVVICADLAQDPRWKGFKSLAAEAGFVSCWSYPVIASDDRLLGTFATYHRQPVTPEPSELDMLRQAVDLVALAVERDQDRNALWESEQRYRSLFAYNPDAVFSLDLQGYFVTANDHCAEITGYRVEQILGTHFSAFLNPADLASMQQQFEMTAQGEPCRFEVQIPHRDGQVRRLDITHLPIVVGQRIKGVYGIAKDVTQRRERETRLRILERGVEASVNGVVIADAKKPDLPIIYANDTFQRITGYTRKEVIGRNCRFLQGPETDNAAVQQIRQQLADYREAHVTLRNYRKDGTPFWNDLYISPVRDDAGQVTHFVGIQHDISERKDYEARLAYHASHDALTGLANRALLEDRLAHDFELARRHEHLLAVLFVDLDEFKPINDSLGHAVGDQLLLSVSKRLSAAMRPGDTLARLGGDEFVVVLPELHHEEQALQVAERLLSIVARPYRIGEHELSLSCSIGIAVSTTELTQAMELIQQADMAMYRAKQQGRNAYQCFTPEITRRVGDRVALRNELQEAIDLQNFELHYQPLIDRQGRVVGMEALLRWPNPLRGYVSPAQFIPLAEETGQIIPISEWVLSRACQDLEMLDAAGQGILNVAVNLSPMQFHRSSFLGNLRQTLAVTGLPAPKLALELTEGVLMNDTESAIDILHALRGMGVSVAIDDFGTGFSSLSYLKNLPIDTVKIDRSFVSEVTRNAEDAAIIQGIISMAHHLGLSVVAEGIEHEAQHDMLMSHGCDLFQGFYIAKPMPFERLIEFLDACQPGKSEESREESRRE
ncbi:EAL domain-containing protein [Halomonas ventosae]|uniref:cyclic-guanylate-specific phosphodiesterase n=1 Tax=Halomonas ventosae TaxID=229007 RepID=A0A4V3C249_9GAMM|nr:EAL domain-containing protein [Halomonas ventosae]TDO16809.1 PAS domain S-box-containing protein/diguanylate cyclase (GGDEF)-like protein [Halomonas ventosae]